MKGKIVSVDQLGFDEASRIEGDWGRFSDNELSELSQGKSASSIRSELENGEIALIVDSPSSPLLLREGQGFSVSKSNAPLLSESGAKKIGYRFSGNYSGGTVAKPGGTLHPPKPMPSYTPEPVIRNKKDRSPALEYCFEIVCSEKSFAKNIGCTFILKGSFDESLIGRWVTAKTEYGFKQTASIKEDELKQFSVNMNSLPMGLALPNKIKPRPQGSGIIKESFIPIMPAIQIGERLGFPTEGYYYHFKDEKLVQEYRILGEENCAFYGTKSMHGRVNGEREYNRDQGSLLIYGMIDKKPIDNQYVMYRESQLSLEELSNVNDQWLDENAIKIEVDALYSALDEAISQREERTQKEQKKSEPQNYIVQRDPETHKREIWPAIAEKCGLSVIELLNLNTRFKDDPMSLQVGDSLLIKKPSKEIVKKEVIEENPPQKPKTYNHPLNTYYRYSYKFLSGSTVKSINSKTWIDDDIIVVNLSPNAKKIFCKSCAVPKGSIEAGHNHEPISNFGELAILKSAEDSRSGGALDAMSASGLLVAAGAAEAMKLNLSQLGSMSVSVGGVVSRIPWLGLFVPSQLGDGTLADSQYLQGIGSIETRVKFRFVTDANGKEFVTGYHIGDGMTGYGEPVKVVNVEEVSAGLAKSYIADLGDGIKITWYPEEQDKTPFNLPRPHTDDIDPSTILVRPIESDEIRTTVYPEEELQEFILTFPADSGISPLYVVFNAKARHESGVVTGQGEDITGIWLEKAGQGLGSPIPSQIADKLRGREFSSFDAFRKAFWLEVSKDHSLMSQFKGASQSHLKNGRAPFAPKDGHSASGKVRKFEIHHVKEIQYGGAVYDVDNLRIVTPKQHKNIHSKGN